MHWSWRFAVLAACMLAAGWGRSALADPVPRSGPVAGAVITAKGGEEIQFVTEPNWRLLEPRQDLLSGDALRTNAFGALAILFADRTQIRVGRNTQLVVKDIRANGTAEFALPYGTVWARAERGGTGVIIDTPAAAAAVRGTDWTLNVDRNGRTALAVMDGAVDLSNTLGSVTVGAGEAAVAAIGRVPTKIVLVSPPDREQSLYYLTLRTLLKLMPATPLGTHDVRKTNLLLEAIPAGERSAEDWLTRAEVSLYLQDRGEAQEALAEALARPLSADQRARAVLVQAILAGLEERWSEAAKLFSQALPRLSGRRRVTAIYDGYVARALADPARVEPVPAAPTGRGAPYAELAKAWIAGFREDPKAMLAILRKAEKQYPDETMLASIRAIVALLVDARADMTEALAHAERLDPDDPIVIFARANYKATIEYDLDGALAELRRALATAPAFSEAWNLMGLVQSDRSAPREAEAAFVRAIESDPQDPVPHANYAILLLDQNRIDAAGNEIDQAVALDPAFDYGYLARGRYELQRGNMSEAIENLLAGSVANPSLSQAMLVLAAAYYENGELDAAMQQLDAADRADPNDPVISQARTVIAIDQYQADAAIESAREGVKRMRERGIYTSPLSSSREAGSYLGDAFRFLSLNAWGEYYSEAVFDPFVATSYFDQAINGSVYPYANGESFGVTGDDKTLGSNALSSLMQGLLLDPLSASARNRYTDLVRRPFMDTSVSGGFGLRDGEWAPAADVVVQGFDNKVIPWSFYLEGIYTGTDGGLANDESRSRTAVALVGAEPTPYDRFVFFSSYSDFDAPLPGPTSAPTPLDSDVTAGGELVAGWSHTIGDRNVISAAAGVLTNRDDSDVFRDFLTPTFSTVGSTDIDSDTVAASVGHSYGIGPVTLRYGLEGSWQGATSDQQVTIIVPGADPATLEGSFDTEFAEGHVYADVLAKLGGRLDIQAGATGLLYEEDGADGTRLSPHAGVALMPIDGHWLRAAYMETTELPVSLTLSPVDTVGLLPNQAPVFVNAEVDTLALRWDAEWNPRFFTALEYQRQDLADLFLSIPGTLDFYSFSKARIERASASANLWIGGGLGAFASFAYADSEDAATGEPLPFVPETVTRLGLTFVHPSKVKLSLTETLVGPRTGDPDGTSLDRYALTDAFLNWEPLDRRVAVNIGVSNIFDKDFEVAPDVPGWGRTIAGTLTARF